MFGILTRMFRWGSVRPFVLSIVFPEGIVKKIQKIEK